MADASSGKRGWGIFKAIGGGAVGLATGVAGVYSTALIDNFAKPPKPIANFSCSSEGLTVTCQVQASGTSGWWDFGDGTALEPFDATDKSVSHTYAKPGHYPVKLVVRNFVGEDNERTVNVDLTVPSAATSGGPTISSLSVEPLGGTTAPAMFRVKCELKNVKQAMLFSGQAELKPEVFSGTSTIVRDVVYERPGQFGLQLFGLNGDSADMKFAVINVAAPRPGVLSVVARIADRGERIERKSSLTTATVAVPAKPAGGFEKIVVPEAGWTFAEAKLEKFTSPAAKNVKAEVQPDKKSIKITGEWTGTGDKATKSAGGSDVLIPMLVVQERSVTLPATTQSAAAQLVFTGDMFSGDLFNGPVEASLKLPAPPAGTVKLDRRIAFDLHEMAQKDQIVFGMKELARPSGEQAIRLSNGQERSMRWDYDAKSNVLKISVRAASRVAMR